MQISDDQDFWHLVSLAAENLRSAIKGEGQVLWSSYLYFVVR